MAYLSIQRKDSFYKNYFYSTVENNISKPTKLQPRLEPLNKLLFKDMRYCFI